MCINILKSSITLAMAFAEAVHGSNAAAEGPFIKCRSVLSVFVVTGLGTDLINSRTDKRSLYSSVKCAVIDRIFYTDQYVQSNHRPLVNNNRH